MNRRRFQQEAFAEMRGGGCVIAAAVTLWTALWVALWTGPALAHGVGFERSSEPAEAVRFFYISGDPMAYAAIKVFSPADDKAEYQAGFADAEGRFAFVPNAPGDWRVVASDGMGHQAEAVVAHVAGDAGAAPSAPSPDKAVSENSGTAMALKATLGLSLILNLALLAQWAVRRSRQAGEAARAHQ